MAGGVGGGWSSQPATSAPAMPDQCIKDNHNIKGYARGTDKVLSFRGYTLLTCALINAYPFLDCTSLYNTGRQLVKRKMHKITPISIFCGGEQSFDPARCACAVWMHVFLKAHFTAQYAKFAGGGVGARGGRGGESERE